MAGRRARRGHLAQHFLAGPAPARRLVADAGITSRDVVVDVGAGSGLITDALARRARRVIAVELDPRLAARLRARYDGNARVDAVHADATQMRWPREPFRVVANLPFNRTSAIARHLLDDARVPLVRADVVVQRGFALDRVRGGDLLTLSWAPWYTFRLGRRLPATSFRPPPRVEAVVLVVERRAMPALDPSDRAAWVAMLRAGFVGGRPFSYWLREFRLVRSRSC